MTLKGQTKKTEQRCARSGQEDGDLRGGESFVAPASAKGRSSDIRLVGDEWYGFSRSWLKWKTPAGESWIVELCSTAIADELRANGVEQQLRLRVVDSSQSKLAGLL